VRRAGHAWGVVALTGVVACTAPEPAPAARESEATCVGAPRVVRMEGSCAAGRPIAASGAVKDEHVAAVGDVAEYRVCLRVTPGEGQEHARIRANAVWPAEDMRNVLGRVPAGALLWGQGPLKNAEFSAGIGYAVAVQDDRGETCRGYIAGLVVEVVPTAGAGGF
jgi:hypothetical protein